VPRTQLDLDGFKKTIEFYLKRLPECGTIRLDRALAVPTEMSSSLAGKVAFVAGASSGIGARVAEALAREGAAVAVAARSEREDKLPGTIHAVADRVTSAGRRATVITRGRVPLLPEQLSARFGQHHGLRALCRW